MPNQRPYFANFLAAFRIHSALKSPSATSSTSTANTHPAGVSNTSYSTVNTMQQQAQPSSTTPQAIPAQTQPTPTRPIPSKNAAGLAAAAAAFSPPATMAHHTRHSSNVAVPRSPASPINSGAGSSGGRFGGRARRGSDSSSDGGFRDALGGEQWFIGGRTANGEERFYGLAMVRRDRSGERASVDRMSL
jgi:hypothetical protein